MSSIEKLLTVARRYASSEMVPLSTVSFRVFDDGKKLRALETGSDITVGRFEAAMQWFSDNWPDGGDWPEEIPRPRLAADSAN